LKTKALFLFSLIVVAVLLVPATSQAATMAPTNTPVPTNATSSPNATFTPTPTPTHTPAPIRTPVPTPTPTPPRGSNDELPVDEIPPAVLYVAEQPIMIPLYTFAVVTVTFEKTPVHAWNVSKSYSSSTNENYDDSSGYAIFTLSTGSVDVFTLRLEAAYPTLVSQTVVIRGFGNGTASNAIICPITMNATGFVLDITILTSEAPHYPTAEDVASASLSRFEEASKNNTEAFNSGIAEVQNSSVIIGSLGSVGFFIALGVLVFFGFYVGSRSRKDAEVKLIREELALQRQKVKALEERK
jgi:hypothetical protein